MTKKDYELIAGVFYGLNFGATDERRATTNMIAERLASALAQANHRFDRAKFLKACGLETS